MSTKNKIERESIAGRVMEFLKMYPPFDKLPDLVLKDLSNHVSIFYLDNQDAVFRHGDDLQPFVYIIRKGQVRIVSKQKELVDICSEGEIFGARALMESEVYQADAIAENEALLFKMPVARLRKIIAENASAMEFFFGDFSSGVALRKRKLGEINAQVFQQKRGATQAFDYESGHIESLKTPITCRADFSIKQAAEKMSAHSVGSIVVVDEDQVPIGIVTDTDLRKKVVTGQFSISDEVQKIMSAPVKVVPFGKSSDEYLMKMLVLKVHHLCVTENGLESEPLKGVITDHDLLVSRGNNAAALLKALRKSTTDDDRKIVIAKFDAHIKNLVLHEFPILDIASINQVFNRELLGNVINEELTKSTHIHASQFCLVALGSAARSEQIIRTDFDSAIILRDEASHAKSGVKIIMDSVFEKLISYGYHSDKAGIQANSADWILTQSEWQQKFDGWMNEPTETSLLHTTIFFDLTPFFGQDELAVELQQFIQQKNKSNKRFVAFLAQNALQNPPPLGFFKNFLLEKSGEHKDAFDIKARAMMPLADAARLQALANDCMFPASTVERYQRLIQKDKIHAARYEDCAVAYEIFMRIRAVQGLTQNHDGRYISPEKLSTLEKQMLKKAFEPIAAIQHLIKPM